MKMTCAPVIFLLALFPISTIEIVPKRDYPIRPVAFTQVKIMDSFWQPRLETNRRVTIPFAFKKCEETGRINNFLKAAGRMPGPFQGKRYNDSDVYKIIEGAAYSLSLDRDPELERYLDTLIETITAAQEPDGYLYAARTVDPRNPPPGAGPERWSFLESSHELYNAGHLYEAAAAHFQATGKRALLEVALKNADLIASVFGPGRRYGFPGHQEIEIGLAKLYRLTGKVQYLDLAKYFLEVRGQRPYAKKFPENSPFAIYNLDWYLQAHRPVLEQTEAVGHAVRAMYMYSGLTDVAALLGDERFGRAADRLWENVTSRKTCLTGGVGSRSEEEAFGGNYELPNATAYNETCAAIGSVLWNHRLFLRHGEAKYLDVLERTLYNGLLAGVSLSGDLFFYPNPLESDGRTPFNQGAATRQPWFEVACCPSNLARFLPSLPGTILAQKDDALFVNLYIQSEADLRLGPDKVRLTLETGYPWQGWVRIKVEPERPITFSLNLRLPGWSFGRPMPGGLYAYTEKVDGRPSLRVNSKPQALNIEKGFARLRRLWKKRDVVDLELPMPVRRVTARPEVREDAGKVAIERGPLVYCFEAVDNSGHVLDRTIPDSMDFKAVFERGLLGGVVRLEGRSEDGQVRLAAVPYYAWAHRGPGEMAVWLPRKTDKK
jgi:DUF1680 family protein